MADPEAVHGFDLTSVCWGYRQIFREALEGLFAEGWLGDARPTVTAAVMALLGNADQSCYDHMLRDFIGALNPQTRWLFDVPAIFADLCAFGHALGSTRTWLGMEFFRLLGQGRLGETPEHLRIVLDQGRRLLDVDGQVVAAFLRGYHRLVPRLTPREIEFFIREGRMIAARNPQAGQGFLAVESRAAEDCIRRLTRECRLEDVDAYLALLLKALTGYVVTVADLGGLDADELVARGSSVVCLYRHLFLPRRIRHFRHSRRNRDWYRLCAVGAAALLVSDAFAVVHGHRNFPHAGVLAGNDPARLNCLVIADTIRALRLARRRWPGLRRLLGFGLATERRERPPRSDAERFFHDALTARPRSVWGRQLARRVDGLANVFAVAKDLREPFWDKLVMALPGLGDALLPPLSFLPDPLYPGVASRPPADALIADLRQRGALAGDGGEPDGDAPGVGDGADADGNEDAAGGAGVQARFWYPEWHQAEEDYRPDWCGIITERPDEHQLRPVPPAWLDEATRVGQVFERLRPDDLRKTRRLETGDDLDPDRLVAFSVDRRVDPDPRVDFYEKPLIRRRDLAVLVLLDLSGSTGQRALPDGDGIERIIEVERRAALLLGQGLHLLGDRFLVAGFHTNGRERCHFVTFKDFDDPWDAAAIGRIGGAVPRNATRMGAPLRHAGWLLDRAGTRQRLLLLVTDGRPMDDGYDSANRYAQHDVRMACLENERRGVATFAISTEENSQADMELMFPRGRFVILPDIRRLPQVLPRLFLRVTL